MPEQWASGLGRADQQAAEPHPHPPGHRVSRLLDAFERARERGPGRVQVGLQEPQHVAGRGAQRPGDGQPGGLLRRGVGDRVGHAEGQADPLPDQPLVRLAGRSCQRLTKQPGAEVGVPDPLPRPASQPGPGQALVDLLERQPRIGVAALPQPTTDQSLAKGSRGVVMGRLQQRSWTAEDAARSVVEVVVEELGPSLR